jgi:hypothetical protein
VFKPWLPWPPSESIEAGRCLLDEVAPEEEKAKTSQDFLPEPVDPK